MLKEVKRNLSSFNEIDRFAIGASCILCCQAALESIVNTLLDKQDIIQHWNELRLSSKIDTIADLENEEIDWGVLPWQDITRLIRVRNWLSHNKEINVGFRGAEGEWIDDLNNSRPRVNPRKELSKASVRRIYDSVRGAGLELSEIAGLRDSFDFLDTQDYDPVMNM